jgi:BirA family transcriptional regulator, biotin operon repressor / biotin---[acetyl-CoA-carboxylase] ligase
MLHPSAIAAGVRIVAHETVGSTNAEALALARTGERGPVWVTAARQTSGRGRRGRAWVSEPGNLYATLLLIDACSVRRAPELSFVAALALHDAVVEAAPELAARLSLKWPNDLLADRAKLAGVLAEGENLASGSFSSVLGFGLNCAHHPDGTAYITTDLRTLGFPVTPHKVLQALSGSMIVRLEQWDRGSGFAAIRRDWLARAGGIGEPIRVRTAQAQVEGVFSTLDPMGRIVLAASDGSTHVIGAGDVLPMEPLAPQPIQVAP